MTEWNDDYDQFCKCTHEHDDHDYTQKKRKEPLVIRNREIEYHEWTECLICGCYLCLICDAESPEACTCGNPLSVLARDEPDCTDATQFRARGERR